jgi:hypothetical protein
VIAKSGKTQLSANDLALLGAGKIGYIRKMRSEDVSARFPEAPVLDPGLELWALFGADGTPILLTDNRSSTFYPRRRRRTQDGCPALAPIISGRNRSKAIGHTLNTQRSKPGNPLDFRAFHFGQSENWCLPCRRASERRRAQAAFDSGSSVRKACSEAALSVARNLATMSLSRMTRAIRESALR